MTKWEYVTVPVLVHATKQILDNWGQDGWELVQVVPGMNPASMKSNACGGSGGIGSPGGIGCGGSGSGEGTGAGSGWPG